MSLWGMSLCFNWWQFVSLAMSIYTRSETQKEHVEFMTAVIHPIKINGSEKNDISENFSSGYVKLFRSIRKHWLWQDAEKLKWWIDILLECNHEYRKVN